MKKLCVWWRKPVYVHCPTSTLTPPTRFSYLVCFSVPPNTTTQTHFQHFKAEPWVDAVKQACASFYSALLFFLFLLIFFRPTPPLAQAWVSGNAQRQMYRWWELTCCIKYLRYSNMSTTPCRSKMDAIFSAPPTSREPRHRSISKLCGGLSKVILCSRSSMISYVLQ